MKQENEELKDTINNLQQQVQVMNQTIVGLRNNAQLADRLNSDNQLLNDTIFKLNEKLSVSQIDSSLLQSKDQQISAYKSQVEQLKAISGTLQDQIRNLQKDI